MGFRESELLKLYVDFKFLQFFSPPGERSVDFLKGLTMAKIHDCNLLSESLCFPFALCRHQGFGVLSVILANHAVKLLTSLFQDLQVEALHKVRACPQNQHGGCWLLFWLMFA